MRKLLCKLLSAIVKKIEKKDIDWEKEFKKYAEEKVSKEIIQTKCLEDFGVESIEMEGYDPEAIYPKKEWDDPHWSPGISNGLQKRIRKIFRGIL